MQAGIPNREEPLRKITVKIGLERIDTQKGVLVEALLNSGVTGLVMSLEFARRQHTLCHMQKSLIENASTPCHVVLNHPVMTWPKI